MVSCALNCLVSIFSEDLTSGNLSLSDIEPDTSTKNTKFAGGKTLFLVMVGSSALIATLMIRLGVRQGAATVSVLTKKGALARRLACEKS